MWGLHVQEPTPFSVDWRTAKSCTANNCVQVGVVDDAVGIRDSKDPDGAILRYSVNEWKSFVAGVKNGDFDDLV